MSRRRLNTIKWNEKSWRLLVGAALGQIDPEVMFQKVNELHNHPQSREQESFYAIGQAIPLLYIMLTEWVGVDATEFSAHDMVRYINHHEQILDWVLMEFDKKLTKEAKKSEKRDNKLDDRAKILEQEEDNESYITSDRSSVTEEEGTTLADEDSLHSGDSTGRESGTSDGEDEETMTDDLVESDSDSEISF
jgi:hypothetical protein